MSSSAASGAVRMANADPQVSGTPNKRIPQRLALIRPNNRPRRPAAIDGQTTATVASRTAGGWTPAIGETVVIVIASS